MDRSSTTTVTIKKRVVVIMEKVTVLVALVLASIALAQNDGGAAAQQLQCGVNVACQDVCTVEQADPRGPIGCCCDPLCEINGDCCDSFRRFCPSIPSTIQAGGVLTYNRSPLRKPRIPTTLSQSSALVDTQRFRDVTYKNARVIGKYSTKGGIITQAPQRPLATCVEANEVLTPGQNGGPPPTQTTYPLGNTRNSCEPLSDSFGNELRCVTQAECTAVDALSSCVEIPNAGLIGSDQDSKLRTALNLPASSPPRGFCVRCCCDGFVASVSQLDNVERFGFSPLFTEGVGGRSCVGELFAPGLAGANRYNHPFCCSGWGELKAEFDLL